jgi:putative Mg2+ transporter-C (MgtC) family protein
VEFFQAAFGDLHRVVSTPWCEFIAVGIAFLCGAIVGLERELDHKPAGLRTQILICIGSATFTLVSMSPALGGHEPARIAAQIVTGVGFLGAGSIMRDRHQISGLTTAATIWTVSAIGIVVGAGYVTAGFVLALCVMIVLGSFRQVEGLLSGRCRWTSVVLVFHPDKGKTRPILMGIIDEARGPVRILDEKTRPDGTSEMSIQYCDGHREHRTVLAGLAAMPSIEAIEKPPQS